MGHVTEPIRGRLNLDNAMRTTLNFRGRAKLKKKARGIYMRTLDIEFERDRSIGLGHGCARVAHCVTAR